MKKTTFVLGVTALGLAFLVGGVVVLGLGAHTYQEVTQSLVDERIVTQDPAVLLTYEGARAPDGVEVPKVLIDTANEAHMQALVIREHTLNITGGKTYSEMDREDPNRATYITSLTLQDSLHLAHVSLEIALLVIGIGFGFMGIGFGILVFGLPIVNRVL